MGNVCRRFCCCFCKNKSSASTNNGDKPEKRVFEDIKVPCSDVASSSSTNNGDKQEESVFKDTKAPSAGAASSSSTNETFDEIKAEMDKIKDEMDAGKVDPKDVISHLNNLISNMEENKNPEIVESPTGGFYGMVDKISIKWEKIAKTEIPRELANIMASFLDKVGTSNYILVGLSVIGSILRRSLKVPRNKESCTDFITNLKCLLAILHSHVSNNVSISASALEDLANEIMKSISVCCQYASSGFGNQMLNANAHEAELKDASRQLYTKVQNLELDAQLKALYGIDQINIKLDHIASTHVNVAEEELDENTVGIKERVDAVKRLLLLENKDVRRAAVVLHGQGGMGKSTLARTVISSAKPHASHGFAFASVCFDSEKSDSETHKKELQSSIVNQLSGNNIKVDDIKAGQRELRKVLSSTHCFVFIDNVVQCGQLSGFFPDHLARDGNHSLRILATSRDIDVRSYFPLHDEEVNVYDVDRLDDVSSVVALRKYMDVAGSAQEKFSEEFVKIERIAKLCYGTPILLSTIGRDLKCRRSKPHYYDDVIRRLVAADFSKYDKLKLEDFILSVFNLLDQTTKAAFLDICKLMFREDWDKVRAIVGDTAMEELSDRLMIRKEEYGEVMVHDLLRAMALRLVEKEKNRFRIYLDDDGSGCLELSQLVGSDVNLSKIEALFIHGWDASRTTIYVEPEVFQRLRLLQIRGVRLEFRNEDAEYIPSKLEYLSVSRSYLGGVSQIFDWLKAENSSPPLRTLLLYEWNDEFLGNVEKFVNLERLELTCCPSLRELPSGISHLPRLREIRLRTCIRLQRLPEVGKLPCLKKLQLDGCEQLQCLPEDIGELSSLTHLSMDRCCRLENLATSLAKLGSLEMLSIAGCRNLVALPDEVGKLPCLKTLYLDGCSGLKTLPSSVAGLGRLDELNLNGCAELQCLPEDIGELSSLTHLWMDYCCSLENLPTSLAKLGSLEMLSMRRCRNLVALPDEVGKLPCLKELILGGCSSLKTLPSSVAGLKALEKLDIDDCQELHRLPEDIGELSSLKVLFMDNLSSLETLPSSLAKLTSLENISMNSWSNMVTVPDFISNLYTLKKLNLHDCYNLKELPAYLEGFTNMEVLWLDNCKSLEKLPDLGKMRSLRMILLSGCSKLQIIPPRVAELRDLHYLDIRNCTSIQNAADFIENMLRVFRNSGKDRCDFKYGRDESDEEAGIES